MNGLRWLRIRCNLSTSELADQLGVTRQAVCSWESGKKAIPEKRKNQMAAFFGIDRTYFDEIDEEKRNELIQKAMYFYQKDGKEIYLYRPNKTPKSHDETVTYFQKDREKSLDEEYLLAKKRKQQTIQEIEEQIQYLTQWMESIMCRLILMEKAIVHYLRKSASLFRLIEKAQNSL